MTRAYTVIDNPAAQRFEIHEEGHVAFEDYERFEGGIATYLIRHILDDAIAKGLKIKSLCPMVRAYIDKHPEYQAHVYTQP